MNSFGLYLETVSMLGSQQVVYWGTTVRKNTIQNLTLKDLRPIILPEVMEVSRGQLFSVIPPVVPRFQTHPGMVIDKEQMS